jgi:hypothetical protein
MRYALRMSSSFVCQPHVVQFDGTVITPDIAIDRVYATISPTVWNRSRWRG